MKKNFICFCMFFLFFLMLIFSDITKAAAVTGIELWIFTVLPSLLPFTIISSMLLRLLSSRIKLTWLIIPCGLFCGCPIGGKLASDAYSFGLISEKKCVFLTLAASSLSLSFYINYAFITAYNTPCLSSFVNKLLLILIIILSSFTGAFIVSAFVNLNDTQEKPDTYNQTAPSVPLSALFDSSILSSFEIQSKIGALIILFSIISSIISHSLNISGTALAIFSSLLEITKGLSLFSDIPSSSLINAVITSLLSFGGLCTIFQTKCVMPTIKHFLAYYIISKIISSLIVFFISFIFFSLQ